MDNHKIVISFSSDGWRDYQGWLKNNKKVTKKIGRLIKSIQRNGLLKGIGKPELLKYHSGVAVYSRRITRKDRLLYIKYNGLLIIIGCKGHY